MEKNQELNWKKVILIGAYAYFVWLASYICVKLYKYLYHFQFSEWAQTVEESRRLFLLNKFYKEAISIRLFYTIFLAIPFFIICLFVYYSAKNSFQFKRNLNGMVLLFFLINLSYVYIFSPSFNINRLTYQFTLNYGSLIFFIWITSIKQIYETL